MIILRLRGLCFIQDSSLYLDLPTVEVAINMVFYLMIVILLPAILLGVFGGSKLPVKHFANGDGLKPMKLPYLRK